MKHASPGPRRFARLFKEMESARESGRACCTAHKKGDDCRLLNKRAASL